VPAQYGLIFDVDGVIADTEAVNATASIRMFRDLLGIDGVVRADFEAGLGRGAAAYVRAAASVHGVELDDEQATKATAIRQEYFLADLKAAPLPAFPGVLALMNGALESEDWLVAIATSSTREKSEAVLRSAHIPYDRMVYVTGSDVTHKKPDPELFLTACDRLGLRPGSCVVIEDAPDGVQAARAAGCRVVAVTNSAPAAKLGAADRVVGSLTELRPGALRRMLD
jgi:HAD superfamily hydrolase (TIGR01509 family)